MDSRNKYRLQALCPACDLVVELPVLNDGERAACPRCGTVLYQYRKNGNSHAAAYAVTALILLVMVYSYYFIRMDVLGLHSSITFPALTGYLAGQGKYLLVGFFCCLPCLFQCSACLPAFCCALKFLCPGR